MTKLHAKQKFCLFLNVTYSKNLVRSGARSQFK